jgi:hypothetical protein
MKPTVAKGDHGEVEWGFREAELSQERLLIILTNINI